MSFVIGEGGVVVLGGEGERRERRERDTRERERGRERLMVE